MKLRLSGLLVLAALFATLAFGATRASADWHDIQIAAIATHCTVVPLSSCQWGSMDEFGPAGHDGDADPISEGYYFNWDRHISYLYDTDTDPEVMESQVALIGHTEPVCGSGYCPSIGYGVGDAIYEVGAPTNGGSVLAAPEGTTSSQQVLYANISPIGDASYTYSQRVEMWFAEAVLETTTSGSVTVTSMGIGPCWVESDHSGPESAGGYTSDSGAHHVGGSWAWDTTGIAAQGPIDCVWTFYVDVYNHSGGTCVDYAWQNMAGGA